jgi:hypothetical protein
MQPCHTIDDHPAALALSQFKFSMHRPGHRPFRTRSLDGSLHRQSERSLLVFLVHGAQLLQKHPQEHKAKDLCLPELRGTDRATSLRRGLVAALVLLRPSSMW